MKFLSCIKKITLAVVVICIALFSVLFLRNTVLKIFVYPLEYKEAVFKYSDKYELERALVFSVIKAESGFKSEVESSRGAVGLMQITPETGEYIADKLGKENYELKEAETNIEFGCFYLRYLIVKFKVEETALAAYNAGEGKVFLWLNDSEYSADGIRLNKIPYRETEKYVEKIEESLKNYRELYGKLLDKVKNFE